MLAEFPKISLLQLETPTARLKVLPSVHNSLHYCDVDELLEEDSRLLLEFPKELEELFFKAVDRLPIPSLIYRSDFTGKQSFTQNVAYVIYPGDSISWYAYKGLERDLPITLIDTFTTARSTVEIDPDALPFIGWQEFYEHWNDARHFHSLHALRSLQMAKNVLHHLKSGGNFSLVCGLAHVPIILRYIEKQLNLQPTLLLHPEVEQRIEALVLRDDVLVANEIGDWRLADIEKKSLVFAMGDLPYLVWKFLENEEFSYLQNIRDIFFDAHLAYRTKFDDRISPSTFRRLFQYLRNLSKVHKNILPSMTDMLTAANAMVDGDYTLEVYRVMVSYPYLPSKFTKLEKTLSISPDESLLKSIRMTFKVRMPRPILKKNERRENPFDDPIPEEDYPGHWQEIWEKYSPYSMVSYPPEDVYIENYFQFLRKRAQELMAEEKAVIEKFTTSLEDGIAWRETLLNWHEKEIHVKRLPKRIPEIGALVVQFQEEENEYNYHMTLYAEHDEESDISVVSTTPGDELIGPGITRIKLAGIVSVFPPEHYVVPIPYGTDDMKMKLLYTAVQMTRSNMIVLVAPRPPSEAHRYLVTSSGYQLLYIPMQQLTKASLHRLRTMHLLAHPDLREIARHYIGF